MATIGDLVVKLRLSNGTFRQNMQDAGRQAQQLDYDIVKLERSTLLAEDSTARLGRAMDSPIYRAQQWANVQAKSNQTVMQARAANDQMAASLANTAVQQNLVTAAALKLDKELMETRQQSQLLTSAQANAGIQAKQLALAESQAALSLTKAKSETAQLAATCNSATISEHQMAIAVEKSNQALLRAQMAHAQNVREMKNATIQANNLKIAQLQLASANGSMGISTGKAQLAISQMVFAVDDATTVYGTSGLTGAVRAASNNLTMMAGLLGGPWALAASVAVSGAIQLYMAFNKTSEAAKEATKSEEKYQEVLRGRNDVIATLAGARHQARDSTSVAQLDRHVGNRRDQLEILSEQQGAGENSMGNIKKQIEERKRWLIQNAKNEYYEEIRRRIAAGKDTSGLRQAHQDKGGVFGFDKNDKDLLRLQHQLEEEQAGLNDLIEQRKQKEQEINILLARRPELANKEMKLKPAYKGEWVGNLVGQGVGTLFNQGKDALASFLTANAEDPLTTSPRASSPLKLG